MIWDRISEKCQTDVYKNIGTIANIADKITRNNWKSSDDIWSQTSVIIGLQCISQWSAGIILCMSWANERQCYNIISLIGWSHTQNYPWFCHLFCAMSLLKQYQFINIETMKNPLDQNCIYGLQTLHSCAMSLPKQCTRPPVSTCWLYIQCINLVSHKNFP